MYAVSAELHKVDIQHRIHLQRFGEADNHTLEKSYRYSIIPVRPFQGAGILADEYYFRVTH